MTSTLVDSNVLIDLVEPGSVWVDWAKDKIARAVEDGDIFFNVVIAAEVAHEFETEDRFAAVFKSGLWQLDEIPMEAARLAGWAHRVYRQRGGRRERTLPDFLIGAHALVAGHQLLTRDARRYRSYFPDIEIIAPDTHP